MCIPIVRVTRCLAWLSILWMSTAAGRADSAGMIARIWDHEISLPQGGYRAVKPIQMDGSFAVNTVPGTYLETIDFLGKAHDQKFKIDGTLLRKCKLIGQLGFRIDAKDSAFDECDMHRTGGWFVDWWATRWKFENCVISRDFLPPEVDVANYAIDAVQCTFLGVKMPGIKYKGDPSKYIQSKDLRFEKCRFVECEIHESLLAACVDCAFENCQFLSKKSDWSKASQPIKVLAFIPPGSHLPQAVLNTRLTVEFVSAPGTMDAGARIPFSPSGGRLALPSVKIPQQFTMLGTIDKKASEVPDLGGGASTPGNATPSPFAPAAADPAEIRSLDDVVRAIPSTAQLVSANGLSPSGIDAANTDLSHALSGKSVLLHLPLDDIRPSKDAGYTAKASAREARLSFHGLTIQVAASFLFKQEDAAALAKVTKGATINLRGTIQKAELQGRNRELALVLTVGDAQLP